MVISPWRIVVLVSHLGVYLKFSIIIIIKKETLNQALMNRLSAAPWMVNEVLRVGQSTKRVC